MVRDIGGLFQRTAVLQVGGNARGPERVVAHRGTDAGRRPAPHHRKGVGLGQRLAGKLRGSTAEALEQGRPRRILQARRLDIVVEITFQRVVAGQFD